MTVTAIITRIGTPRVFDVSTTTGGTKKVNTVEVAMRSGNQNYLGEAFDGNKAYAQKTTVTNAQIVNPHF